jgi:hypothetical protein
VARLSAVVVGMICSPPYEGFLSCERLVPRE